MGLGKEASVGDTLGWPSTSIWEGVACMLDTCGPPLEYRDTLKTLTDFMHLFEEIHFTHCGKGKKVHGCSCALAPFKGSLASH